MQKRENQQLEIRHFKPFFGCVILTFHKITQNFKTGAPKKEKLINKTMYTSTSAKISIKSVHVISSWVILKFNLPYPLNFADT